MEKILLISDHFYPEPFLGSELPSYFKSQGYSVDVLTQNPAYPEGLIYKGHSNPWFQITRMNGIRVYRIKTITGYRDSLVRKIANYLWFMVAASIFVLVTSTVYCYLFVYHVGTLTEAVPLLIGKKLFRKRTSIWTQDIWPDSVFAFGFKRNGISLQILKLFVSSIYSSIDSVMVSSPGFVDKIKHNTRKKIKPVFIPQWAPKELFSEQPFLQEFDARMKNFVFTGNVGTQQNLQRVIEAFGTLGNIGKSCILHIFGDGRDLGELKEFCSRNEYFNVVFYGRIKQNQILDVIKRSDACVLSLNPDPVVELTLPAKFQTYIYSGKPILCVAGGESSALVKEYAIGEIAEPDSITSIQRAIDDISSYTDARLLMIENNQKQIRLLFQVEESKKAILAGIVGRMICNP